MWRMPRVVRSVRVFMLLALFVYGWGHEWHAAWLWGTAAVMLWQTWDYLSNEVL